MSNDFIEIELIDGLYATGFGLEVVEFRSAYLQIGATVLKVGMTSSNLNCLTTDHRTKWTPDSDCVPTITCTLTFKISTF